MMSWGDGQEAEETCLPCRRRSSAHSVWGGELVAGGGPVTDLDAAQRLRWGAVRATTFVNIISESIMPDGAMRIYDNTDEMLSALRTGKVDAVLLDMPLAVLTARRSHGRLRAAAQL